MIEIPDHEANEYASLRLYSIDLDMARQSCDLLARVTDAQVSHALLRDTIISYCRPFSVNRRRNGAKHSLKKKFVPTGMRAFHAEVFDLRNHLFAHTDEEFRNPQIARWPRSIGGATYLLGFSNPPYERLLARIAELRSLICAVEDGVNSAVRDREARLEKLYADAGEVTE